MRRRLGPDPSSAGGSVRNGRKDRVVLCLSAGFVSLAPRCRQVVDKSAQPPASAGSDSARRKRAERLKWRHSYNGASVADATLPDRPVVCYGSGLDSIQEEVEAKRLLDRSSIRFAPDLALSRS